MYRGFNLLLENLKTDDNYWHFNSVGKKLHKEKLDLAKFSLENFLNNDSTLNGSAIQKNWFPSIKADVFISHSHADIDHALVIAGWLSEKFQLDVFIDSCIWGHANSLLRIIDNKHCFNSLTNTYSYELRNHSTSHVHMMLSTALSMMIDKTECLFFINMPNSVKSYNGIDKTQSPWIYSEIALTKIIQKRTPVREITESFSNADGLGNIEKSLKVTFDLNLDHLTSLDFNQLNNWEERKKIRGHPLDLLYNLYT